MAAIDPKRVTHGGNLYADVQAEAQRRLAEILARLGVK